MSAATTTTTTVVQTRDAGPSEVKAALWTPTDRYAQAARLSLVIGVLVLAPSWYMFEVYGRVLNSRSESTLGWMLLAAIGIFVVLELLELARSRVLHQAAIVVARRLSERVFNASFQAKLKRLPGGGSQPLNDVRSLSEFVQSPALSGLMDMPSAVLCLVLLFAMNVWVGTLALVVMAINVGLGFVQQRRSALPHGQAMAASAEAQGRAYATLRNAPVMEALGMQRAMFRQWIARQRAFMKNLSLASDRAGAVGSATKLLATLQGSLLLGMACWMALRNELFGGPPMIIVASILGGRALAPMAAVVGQWRQIGAAQTAYRRLDNLLQSMPIDEPGMPLPAPQGHLSVEHITVMPPGSATTVLRNVSFNARPGELLTIFGASASGKSSLARALIGVWPPQSGAVRLDGADVHAWHKSQLGPHVGYLAQNVELFDGTVAENIARFGKVDMALVRQACDMVGITRTIEALPQGFDTEIGDDGAVLSGGQRQRIGLARALYGLPQLLVLDEPNSSLDEAGERDLMTMIQIQKARGATTIAITHRKSLLAAADKLLMLHEGAVSRFGTRDEVMSALQAMAQQSRAALQAPQQQLQQAQQTPRTAP